ncbi:MAG: response regulator [Verrucomicrobiales bacterium]
MNPKTILIVEDDHDALVWLMHLVRRAGYRPLTAQDALQALRVARSDHPDLILLDMNLPAGNGEFVLDKIAEQTELYGIPVIGMSGDPNVDGEAVKRLGACAFLKKPADNQDVLDLIERVLDLVSV